MKNSKLKINDFDINKIEKIVKEFNLTNISAKILLNRKLENHDDIYEFLYPDFKNFENAAIYKDLDKGCKRILHALKIKEKILIYGDYDVDGVTSISQFMIYLKKAGANVLYYVPDRESEGYGISDFFWKKSRIMKLILTY